MQIQLKDFALAYEERGQGKPLLLIHGYPLSRAMWEPQLEGLVDTARLIAPDLRGHGQSDPVPGPYSMELLADDCAALLEAMKVTQPVVVAGLSMGGYVALAFYRKYAARVAGLILAATRAGADSPEGQANRDKSAALAREKGVDAIVEAMLPKMLSPKSYEVKPKVVAWAKQIMQSASVEGIVGALMGMKNRPDATPTLAQIDKPTLILHGADDQLIPPKEAEALHAGIKNSKLQILPEAGHLLNLEQPELFNEAVRGFLESF